MGTEQETIDQLRAKHGPLAHFVEPRTKQLFVFRTPSIDEWEDFEESQKKGTRIGPPKRQLCMQTLVHPTGDDGTKMLVAAFERAPRLPTLIGDQLVDLAEGEIEVTIKKD